MRAWHLWMSLYMCGTRGSCSRRVRHLWIRVCEGVAHEDHVLKGCGNCGSGFVKLWNMCIRVYKGVVYKGADYVL